MGLYLKAIPNTVGHEAWI